MNSSATGNKHELIEKLDGEGENAGSQQQQQVCYENVGEKLIFRKQHDGKHALKIINAMRKQNLFYDVTLEVDEGSTIKAHKMVLAAGSPYFSAMFANFKERNQSEIKIHGINHSTLEILLDFIYTSQITITEDNVQDLLSAANYLQLIDVRDACCVFLKSQLHVSNCCQVRDFAEIHECSELVTHVDNYIEKNFLKFIEEDAFLALPPERVIKIISSDDLAVPSEEKVFESVMSWINADSENRECALTELIEHVRLPLLSMDYFNEDLAGKLLMRNSEIYVFLIEALSYHLSGNEWKIHFRTPRTKPRNKKKILLVFGSLIPAENQSVEYYDFEEEKWFKISELPIKRYFLKSTVFDGRVCLVGGYNGTKNFSEVDFYNVSTGQWLTGTPLNIPRFRHSVTVLDDRIYVVGGDDGFNMNSVEVYNPNINKWDIVSPMLTGRINFGVEVINGLLYAVGGFDGKNYLSSVECYNPDLNEWKYVAGMSTSRCGVGVGVINGILYATGGYDGQSYLQTAEAYDPEKNQWTSISAMTYRRSYHGTATYNGLLYAVGGMKNSNIFLNSVEFYSPKNNFWTTLSSSMSIKKFFYNVAVVNKPETTSPS